MRYTFCFITFAVASAFLVIPGAALASLNADYSASNTVAREALNQHFQTIQDRRDRIEKRGEHFRDGSNGRIDKKKIEQRRKQLREELKSLPPEERRARMQELREKFKNKRGGITEERRQQFRDRWQNASPEEKKRFCSNVQERCEQGHSPACRIAQKACSSL